ncbi:MAG: type II toxin-antitoxin system PemK/MazF family toxin [Bacteroidales bacterium]|nr:type II toxin-antitoxin system PemK/MazF family toxin [Bacteroidales bacterium]
MIINDFEDGDVIVCRITSQIYTSRNDIYINDWKESGLKLPSVIRVHKIAALEKNLVEKIMGRINTSIKSEVRNIIKRLPN